MQWKAQLDGHLVALGDVLQSVTWNTRMGNDTSVRRQADRPKVLRDIIKRGGQILAVIAVQAAIMFLSSGRLGWWQAWVYIGIYLVAITINAFILARYNPEIIAERARVGENMKTWDKVIGGLFAVAYLVLTFLVAGLDFRFGWTGQINPMFHLGGAVGFALGFALIIWAMASNAYFTTFVRIQEDRGQAVCNTGPYRFVRHPGYVGAVLQALTTPLLLGSIWAYVPAGVAIMLMVARTALEDRTLRVELAGYEEYATQTRYRLLPGIW